jgi:hypothetical protein
MQGERNNRLRRREVVAGLVIILATFVYFISILFDFDFVSSYATLEEDLGYLYEQISSQMISSIAWITTALVTMVSIPFYLLVFHNRLQTLHFLNGLFLLGASLGFLLMGKTGLDLHQAMLSVPVENFQEADEGLRISLLQLFRQEQLFRSIGSSFVGLFAIGLALTKFRMGRFPLFSAGILLVSGPVLIFFNWYDPDPLVRTGAMAGIMIGMVVFSVRLINRGLSA